MYEWGGVGGREESYLHTLLLSNGGVGGWQGTRVLNPKGVRAWKEGHECVWRQHGVWDWESTEGPESEGKASGAGGRGKAVLRKKDYFHWRRVAGADADAAGGERVKVDLMNDYFVPFLFKFKEAINAAADAGRLGAQGGGQLLVFVDRDTDFEDAAADHCPSSSPLGQSAAGAEGFVWAPHWYDLVPLVTKSFRCAAEASTSPANSPAAEASTSPANSPRTCRASRPATGAL